MVDYTTYTNEELVLFSRKHAGNCGSCNRLGVELLRRLNVCNDLVAALEAALDLIPVGLLQYESDHEKVNKARATLAKAQGSNI